MNQLPRNRFGSSRKWRSLFIIGSISAALVGLVMLIRWLRSSGLGPSRRQRGFTLIEVVLGVVIISTIGIAIVRAIDTNARTARTFDEKVQATNLVTAYLENIRQLDYDDSANPYASLNATIIKPPRYDVSMDFAYGSSSDGVNIDWYPTSNNSVLKLQKITISVFRTDGRSVLSTCTYRTAR